MSRMTDKKQFRLYDIYRYAATGVASKIRGIHSYEVNKDATRIVVRYDNLSCVGPGVSVQFYSASNENDLKEIIRKVNKRLGNCRTPGRRKSSGKQLRLKI